MAAMEKMKSDTKKKKRRKSITELDREMEAYSLKLLKGEVQPEDTAKFEMLANSRKSRLVRLKSIRRSPVKPFKVAG